MILKIVLLVLSLLSLTSFIYAQEINSDGSEYKAPRLAGDSLAIKSLKSDTFTDMGNFKALLRYNTEYRDTSYHSTQSGQAPQTNKVQQYSAFGGYIGYETPTFYGVSAGATLYTAQKIGNNPDERTGLGGLKEEDGTAYSYAVLGEAYIKYKSKNHDVRYGRREMPNYRFVSLSNIRFSPYTHEGATYENSLFGDVKISLGYINKQKGRNSETFEDMVRSARVEEKNIRGLYDSSNYSNGNYIGKNKSMAMMGLTFKKKALSLEAWNYYVKDFVNTAYFYGDYSFGLNKGLNFTTALQFAQQKNVGNSVVGDINTYFYGLKAQLAFTKGITLFSAYNQVDYNENSYAGGTLFVRWGTPQMFNSYQVQDSELAGTQSLGVGAQFELGKMHLVPNTVIRFRYAYYNMPDSINDRDAAQDRSEATFDLRYSFTKNDGFGIFTEMKGLSLQFRIAYDDYKTNYDYEAYKARWNRSFENVTKDFIDTRLYIDYIF